EEAVQSLVSQLADKERAVHSLSVKMSKMNEVINQASNHKHKQEQEYNALESKLNEREQVLEALNTKLLEIYGSRAWRVIQLLWKIRLVLLPPNSPLTSLVKKIYRLRKRPAKAIEQINDNQVEIDQINSSTLFDRNWYLSTYPDIAQAKVDPASHYLLYGAFEGRDAGPKFSSNWYFEMYPDVSASGMNPLIHYIKHGQYEGRIPNIEATLFNEPEFLRTRAFQIVPYYLNPGALKDGDTIEGNPKIAVHLHMHYQDMLEQCALYLNNIPLGFDLYLSVTEKNDPNEISAFLKKHVQTLEKIIVKKVPNRGRDLAPMIVDFGEDLLNYDFVAHIHTKKSPHSLELKGWFEDIMNTLLGSQSGVYQIFNLLSGDAKFIYPASNQRILSNENGWGDNYDLAKSLLPQLLGESIETYPLVEFPQGSMFWAKSSTLDRFLRLPLAYTDFPVEPIPADGTMLHVLERLLLVSASQLSGRNYRIYLPSSTIKEPYYEPQKDYYQSQVHDSVKVLSYYLPQFYPTPENDEWHGKGFTEWTKVRSANPLFYGHYQQRVPHDDIGYYSLASSDMFKKQVDLMKSSGVYGQIFYHYWFTGKLILEKPAKMLLADKTIEMPFCFCWANENWTKKWDGNEDEILLGQEYSEQDAIHFINYLIPFFKDERYIKIEDRPVLYIYRPSSIPDFEIYKKAWEKVCAENGIKAPFIVAVLTRGAKSPNEFGMDAGCERVLHDWTDGNVKEIKNKLYPYWPINGRVLDYSEVADYYMSQPPNTDFTYFRSIIPSWDNTPRYASEAYIIHNSSPEKFQKWLEALVVDAEERLPLGQRFVVVNAWNEWAESAVLEPDSRFGYAYLNSIGRALSGINFDNREYLHHALPKTTQISISFTEKLLKELNSDKNVREKMLSCIAHSTIFSLCNVFFDQSQVAEWASVQTKGIAKPDYTLYIKDVCYFAPDALENMLKMALCYDAGVVTPSHLNDPSFTHQFSSGRWESRWLSPYMFLMKNGDMRSLKCCVDAGIFISPPLALQKGLGQEIVSTIVRFSQAGNINLLRNALYSLVAQVSCKVQPILAVQDLTDDMLSEIKTMLEKMPWNDGCSPIIREYHSTENNPDLRSLMLNDSLKAVKTQFAAFLDYDDIIFHDAYAWLLERLQKTGKNASFGLIYNVLFNLTGNRLIKRSVVYNYGKDYENFLTRNHSPIHGIMLNLSKINLDEINYYEDMKYMEDYYLTLQIFTKGETDWDALPEQKFVGDYYHYEDKAQTLAIIDQSLRNQLIASQNYAKCEDRINEMRFKIQQNNNLQKPGKLMTA
ncbi:MAG TPA: hypothetical protein DCG34_06260, partial [Clostridiales bacterium]|nr:hypothetical protein [Clostridiales bacterium]